MELLKSFVTNEPIKQAVHNFLIQTLEQEIVTKAFSGEDIKGYVEAKKIIDKSFNNLEGQYGNKTRSTQDPR